MMGSERTASPIAQGMEIRAMTRVADSATLFAARRRRRVSCSVMAGMEATEMGVMKAQGKLKMVWEKL